MKILALGNRLMKDDGVALYVVKALEKSLEPLGFEVFYGETDIMYCLEILEKELQPFIIVDAFYSGQKPGTVTTLRLDEIKKHPTLTQHALNLPKALSLYHMNTIGIFIGIEVADLDYDLQLSSELDQSFEGIKEQVLLNCYQFKEAYRDA